jgi:hypothetical protein
MDNRIQTVSQTALIFGESQEIELFAKRIKTMMRGGDKLSATEALALAQVAKVTHLNPFIGECWYIPGSGPMVGIAGARRIDQEDAARRGGYSTVEVIPCEPQEAGAVESEVKDVAAAFRAEITDSMATLEYQRMFTATLASLRESGVTDPVPVAREICGPRPKWVGYGFSKKGESTRMSKVQAARKRAEADALKKKIMIPFGADVAEADVAPDYVDATATDVPERRSREQNLHELGFESAPKPINPEEAYSKASKVIVKVSGGQERFVSELTKEQLDFLMTSDKSTQEQKAAARIVLAHDFQMEAEPQ